MAEKHEKTDPTGDAKTGSSEGNGKAGRGDTLVVRGPQNGLRRAGIQFGPEEIEIPLAALTKEQAAAIEGETLLSVKRVAG